MKSNKDFIKEIMTLAFPVAFQSLISQVLYLINNIMVGSLSEINITAVSVSNTFLWLCSTAISGICSGAVIICAQEYGRGAKKNIRDILSFIMVANMVIACLFFGVIAFFGKSVIHLYSNIDGVAEAGAVYLRIMKYSILFSAISTPIVNVMHSLRNVKLGFVSSVTSCLVNALVNYLFIYGRFGMPALGISGAALGTLSARICEMLIAGVYLLFLDKELEFKIKDFNPRLGKDMILTLVKVTLPVVGISILENLVSSAQTMITGHISEHYVSANTIVHSGWTIPSVFAWGIGMAASIIIGNELGKGNKEEVVKDSKRFVILSFVQGIFSVILMQLLLPVISSRYNVGTDTLQLAKEMGYYACVSCFFNCVNAIVCNGVIKSNGNTKILLLLDIVFNWIIIIPFGYLAAFKLNFPPASLYLILRLGTTLKSIWGLYQIYTGKWLKDNIVLD